VQQIIGGVMDDGGTEAMLAARIGLSARHLRRLFLRHLGVSPDQLARSRRAHFARRLLDDTDLTDVRKLNDGLRWACSRRAAPRHDWDLIGRAAGCHN
jgi:methylphosphotriester-DNA--protein-cysteine methyltransferase